MQEEKTENKKSNRQQLIDVENIKEETEIFKVVSLFSGCGGMDLGFHGGFEIFGHHYKKNNFEIIYANDIDKDACKTYEHNFNMQSICADIKDIDKKTIPKADIVVGGFPCQDFSHAGKRRGLNSERGNLYLEMKSVIEEVKPKAFVAENVYGLKTMKADKVKPALDHIISEFEEIGYEVSYKVLNSADYGVPQTRIRIIIIGIDKKLDKEILFPKPVRSENGEIPWLTAKEAIDDLWDKIEATEIPNHTQRDYSKAKFYPGKRMQGNNQIKGYKPSTTIRAEHHGNIEAHYRTTMPDDPGNPLGWRRLSVRECARLQSFPDNFVYASSASKAYKQVGNAVPPILAWYVARALYASLTK